VLWTVDARKLYGNDKQIVSPPFDPMAGRFQGAAFKLLVHAKAMNEGKGGTSFKKSSGRGSLQLKCESDLGEAACDLRLCFSVGAAEGSLLDWRGPLTHDFSKGAVCGTPSCHEQWDFLAATDQDSMTFVICLDVVPLCH